MLMTRDIPDSTMDLETDSLCYPSTKSVVFKLARIANSKRIFDPKSVYLMLRDERSAPGLSKVLRD
jgi:hypothetical protein